ncbi:hypothetical protein [Hydrogenobaculum acidophilum]
MEDKTSALISALALLMAERAGIMEDIPLKEIGILAGVIASATGIIRSFINDEINKEQTIKGLEDAIDRAFHAIFSTTLDSGHAVLTTYLEKEFGVIGSMISKFISEIYHQHRDTLIESAKDLTKNILKNYVQ